MGSRMRIVALCLISSMSLLAACSKGPAATTASSAPSGEAKTAAPSAAFSMPHRKAGLWKIRFATDSGPGIRMNGELCIDEKTDATTSYAANAGGKKDCDQTSLHPADGGFAFDTTCRSGSRTITSHGVVTGDFNNNYAVAVTIHTDPPIQGGPSEVRTQIKADWQGPCKPGQVPGSVSAMKFAGLGKG